MTQLPATLLEHEARTYARAWLAECGDMDPEGIGLAIKNPAYGFAWLRRWIKTIATSDPQNRMMVIDWARRGWDEADTALRELAIEIIDRGEKLPTSLGAFTQEVLRGHRAQRGPRKGTYAFQNILVAGLTAELVVKFNLKPTRHRLSKSVSACDIVADTVNGANIGRSINYKMVEALWNQWGKWLLPDRSNYLLGHRGS